jgi:hypothetical protein
MDQLKTQLAVVLKYGFWIGSALILISSLAVWYMSTATLVAETESESSRLTSTVRKISTVSSGMSEVPNEDSHKAMQEIIKQRQAEVLESWKTLYQRQEPYLVWPQHLESRFLALYEDKIPIELHLKPTDVILEPYRKTYRDHIKSEPAKLARVASAEWTIGERESSPDNAVRQPPVVAWSESSQKDLERELFDWRGDIPTALEIYYSQESQWILNQLMMIIKEVNGDVTQPYLARIREINEIKIGRSVRFNAGEIGSVQGSSTSLDSISSDSPMASPTPSAWGDVGLGGDSSQASFDPAEGRYVDKNLKPISAEALRTALESNRPADASLAVAKRVPVMMRLTMDQRYIHELLAACGSADMMVEVAHVRVLGESQSSGASSASAGSGTGGSSAFSGLGGPGSGAPRSATPAQASTGDEYPFDVKVEVFGIIYLYNPPDLNKLPVEQVTKENVEEALGETPAAEAPAAETSPAESPAEPLDQVNGELPPAVPPAEPAAAEPVPPAVPPLPIEPAEDTEAPAEDVDAEVETPPLPQ